MKIIHISDLHLSAIFKRNNLKKTKKIFKHALSKGFDHLVVTGDISDNANEKELLLFRKLLKTYDLLNSQKVSIIIGNHDIFGGVQTALDVIDFPRRCMQTNYDDSVNKFISYFEELFVDSIYPCPQKFFPYAKIVKNVALIGMNSIAKYSRLKNPFASNGKVNDDQINDFKILAAHPQIKQLKKIVMIHHHFYRNNVESACSYNNVWNKLESFTMKLRGKKQLISLFKQNNVELVLHGHSHEVKDYLRKNIRFLNAGGTIDNNSDSCSFFVIEEKHNTFNVELQQVESQLLSPLSCILPKIKTSKIILQHSN